MLFHIFIFAKLVKEHSQRKAMRSSHKQIMLNICTLVSVQDSKPVSTEQYAIGYPFTPPTCAIHKHETSGSEPTTSPLPVALFPRPFRELYSQDFIRIRGVNRSKKIGPQKKSKSDSDIGRSATIFLDNFWTGH